MQLRQFFTDDDAVSPVIGVILMVAITVILAAVIGAFVLGFGGGGPSAPSVTWETSDENVSGNTTVEFAHGGGDTITDADEVLQAGGDYADISTENNLHDGSGSGIDSELSTGSSVHANASSSGAEEVTLVWSSPDSDSTQELASHSV